jgi:hypothetical protein
LKKHRSRGAASPGVFQSIFLKKGST